MTHQRLDAMESYRDLQLAIGRNQVIARDELSEPDARINFTPNTKVAKTSKGTMSWIQTLKLFKRYFKRVSAYLYRCSRDRTSGTRTSNGNHCGKTLNA